MAAGQFADHIQGTNVGRLHNGHQAKDEGRHQSDQDIAANDGRVKHKWDNDMKCLLYQATQQVTDAGIGRLKGHPLSLGLLYVQRDDHRVGLIRLLSIALRVVTVLG